jgi:hypothetical protein
MLPEEPEVPEEPELELPAGSLAPEVSVGRRSQPTAVKPSAATTNNIFDVVFSVCIPVPFNELTLSRT